MEYSAAQALADLGLARRDMISTSDNDSSGRANPPNFGKAEVINDANRARKARISTAGSSHGGAAIALQAWNSPANFDRDDVAEQLEDRGSGQSHRAALSARLRHGTQYEAQYEETQVRYGEERASFLRDRSNNYVASTTPQKSKQERFRELLHYGPATPRIVPNASSSSGRSSRAGQRGRVVSTPQNPNRALSPRSYGTVRYGPGNKHVDQPSASMSASLQAAAMLREKGIATADGTRSPTTPSQGDETTAHQPTQRSDAVRPSLAGQSSTTADVSSSTEVARSPANLLNTATRSFSGSTRNGDGAHSQVADLPKHSYHDQIKYTKLAEYHVANPGPEADDYRKKQADREYYFREAEKSLVKKAFYYAKNIQSQETQKYLSDYKDRGWMLHEALKAKDFVERDALAEMDAYHAAHPHLVPFGKAAKANFKPKFESSAGPSQQSTSVVESDRNGGATDSAAVARTVTKGSSPVAKTNMWEMRNSAETDVSSSSNGSVIRAPGSEGAPSAASSRTVIARAEPAEAAAASDAQQNSTSSSLPRNSSEQMETVDTATTKPKDAATDLNNLISNMEKVAARLNAMSSTISALCGSNGAGASVNERKLEGVKMEEDGLCLSDGE
ncbi:hypothetical protein NU219Hw_g7990t1 [Hortaea werneckii]